MSKTIYLGKNGETFGPFSNSELDELKSSGKIAEYTWIRNEGEANWRPLDAPPPPTMGENPTQVNSQPAPESKPSQSSPKSKKKSVSRNLPKGIQAICHNNSQIMSGTIHEITEDGCFFVASGTATEPKMGTQSMVILNLLDEKSGRSMNVPAHIRDTKRSPEGWTYRIEWENCPAL